MAAIQHVPLFLLAGLLLNLTPGADMLFIATRAGTQGWRAGAVAALGVGAGCMVHVTAAAAGLSALVAASATAFNALRLLGAAYLVWIGIGLLRPERAAAGSVRGLPGGGPVRSRGVFAQGVLTNVLNPKVVLFFLAFLPQFVRQGAAHPGWAMLLLGVVFTVNGTLFNLGVAWGVARMRGRLGRMQGGLRWLRRGTGALFVALGARLAVGAR